MKFVRRLGETTHPAALDARLHGHDVIPAQAGIQGFAQLPDMSQLGYAWHVARLMK